MRAFAWQGEALLPASTPAQGAVPPPSVGLERPCLPQNRNAAPESFAEAPCLSGYALLCLSARGPMRRHVPVPQPGRAAGGTQQRAAPLGHPLFPNVFLRPSSGQAASRGAGGQLFLARCWLVQHLAGTVSCLGPNPLNSEPPARTALPSPCLRLRARVRCAPARTPSFQCVPAPQSIVHVMCRLKAAPCALPASIFFRCPPPPFERFISPQSIVMPRSAHSDVLPFEL